MKAKKESGQSRQGQICRARTRSGALDLILRVLGSPGAPGGPAEGAAEAGRARLCWWEGTWKGLP